MTHPHGTQARLFARGIEERTVVLPPPMRSGGAAGRLNRPVIEMYERPLQRSPGILLNGNFWVRSVAAAGNQRQSFSGARANVSPRRRLRIEADDLQFLLRDKAAMWVYFNRSTNQP